VTLFSLLGNAPGQGSRPPLFERRAPSVRTGPNTTAPRGHNSTRRPVEGRAEFSSYHGDDTMRGLVYLLVVALVAYGALAWLLWPTR